jgi:sulfate transport system ATP-binding protein
VSRITFLGAQVQLQLVEPDGVEFDVHLNRNQFAQLDLKRGQNVFVKPLETRIFSEVA